MSKFPSSANSPAKVCIVIPLLNEAKYLRQSLDSVFMQDYPNLEVVIYDGGSTDGSQEIAASYPCKLIIEKGLGQMAAINKGWRATDAEFVTWWAGDDIYKPGAIRRLAAALADSPQLGFVHANAELINAQGELIGHVNPGNISLSDLALAFRMMPQSSLIRKAALSRSGMMDEGLRLAADWDLFLRLAQYFPIAHLQFTASARRLHEESEDAQDIEKTARGSAQVLRNFFSRTDLTAGQLILRRRSEAAAHAMTAWALAVRRQKRDALQSLARAARTWLPILWKCQPARSALFRTLTPRTVLSVTLTLRSALLQLQNGRRAEP